MKEIAILYSGGTDSTAATSLLAGEFDRVHLLTYKHSGITRVANTNVNVAKLRELFGQDRFLLARYDIDRLFKRVTFAGRWRDLRKHGLLGLSSCGLCKLSMHIRTVIYCADQGIETVADGANKGMTHFPAQMAPVISEIRAMYRRFGIEYLTPVFDYESPAQLGWQEKLGIGGGGEEPPQGTSTGDLLYERGITPARNVKGTEHDRQMQARCMQLTLLNLVALKYFIPRYGMEAYEERIVAYYRDKIALLLPLLEEYLRSPGDSPLSRELGPAIEV